MTGGALIGQPPCARFAERAPRMGRRVELRESRARAKNVFTCASRRWIESIVRTRSRRQRGGVGRERSRTFVGFRCTLPRDHPVAKNTRETRARMCAAHHAREVVSRPRTPRTRNTRRMKEDRRDLSGRGDADGRQPARPAKSIEGVSGKKTTLAHAPPPEKNTSPFTTVHRRRRKRVGVAPRLSRNATDFDPSAYHGGFPLTREHRAGVGANLRATNYTGLLTTRSFFPSMTFSPGKMLASSALAGSSPIPSGSRSCMGFVVRS